MKSTVALRMTANCEIRVLHDPALGGAENMARDEALLILVGCRESPPTLRLYQWEQPTISLGYFQRYADYAALGAPAGGLSVVRRLTGGGAILHDLELTYSLVLPGDHVLLARGPNDVYALAHAAIIAALGSLGVRASQCGWTDDSTPTRGPFFCFDRRHSHDVLSGSEKIAGSAQRRTRDALLQHGSIVLGQRYARPGVETVVFPLEEGIRRLRVTMVQHFAQITGLRLREGNRSPKELASAAALLAKYAGEGWTRRT